MFIRTVISFQVIVCNESSYKSALQLSVPIQAKELLMFMNASHKSRDRHSTSIQICKFFLAMKNWNSKRTRSISKFSKAPDPCWTGLTGFTMLFTWLSSDRRVTGNRYAVLCKSATIILFQTWPAQTNTTEECNSKTVTNADLWNKLNLFPYIFWRNPLEI